MAKSRNSKKRVRNTTNKHSYVRTRIDRTGKVRTETARRDAGELDVACSTNERNNSTRVFIDVDGREGNFGGYASLELNGRQARTLWLALSKHFSQTGKYLAY